MNNDEKYEYSYDSLSDALTIDIPKSSKYHDTVTIIKTLLIDIDKNKFPFQLKF